MTIFGVMRLNLLKYNKWVHMPDFIDATKHKLFICFLLTAFFITNPGKITAQENEIEKLHSALSRAKADTVKIMTMYSLYLQYSQKANDSALYFAKKAYALSKKNGDYELGRLAMAVGYSYNFAGDYEKSISYFTEAYEIAKELNYEGIYAVILNNIGMNLFYIKDFTRAEHYFNDALKVAINYDGKYMSYFYLAQIKAAQADHDEALHYYGLALELSKTEQIAQDEAAVYSGLGDLYYTKEDYKTGIAYYENALSLFDSTLTYYQITSYSGIAEGYLQTGEYEKALLNCLLTDSLADAAGYTFELAENKKLLSEVYEKLGFKDLALAHYKKYTSLNDSLMTVENNKQIGYLHVEFETKQKELQLEIMEQDVKLKNRMLLSYISISCLIFLALAFWLKNSQSSNRKLELERQKVIRQLTEKTTKMVQTMGFLEKMKSNIHELNTAQASNKNEFNTLIREIDSFENQNVWNEFEHYFTEVHPAFFTLLKQRYPDLTINELRLCAMLKLAMSTKEIAIISGKTPKSIDVMRTRIRNKMGLDRQDSIYDVLTAL
jgi:tetratricopeptide (TPR) repeat protein/DNA-binding CsgD family transcriptional regulator